MGDFFSPDANNFLRGAIAMGHAIAGLFFLRYYVRSRDNFFLMFSIAFWTLGSIRVVMIFVADPMEQHYLYWVRFVAYVLILAAIVIKNLPERRRAP
jgi:hypothetical protein